MKLGIDLMGSDLGPSELLKAVVRFLNDYPVDIVVYGSDEPMIHHQRLTWVKTSQVMEMEDGPMAIRRKKDASMVVAVEDCIANKTDAVISAGSTGALLSAAVLLSKPLPSIERPALLANIPNAKQTVSVFCDMGANSSNTPDQLAQFAVLGHIYAKSMNQINQPTVGLLNIGSEQKKGDELHQEAFKKIKALSQLNFVGNLEGRDLLSGNVDVIVTDGFSGNIALKTVEGTVSAFGQLIKEAIMSTFLTKIGGLLIKKSLSIKKDRYDYRKHGGAMLAGVHHPIIKAHGSSDQEAFYHAIRQAYQIVEAQVIEKMKREFI